MRIDNLSLIPEDSHLCLAGRIDDFALWYRFPLSCHVRLSSEPFVAASLLPAMLKGDQSKSLQDFPSRPSFWKILPNYKGFFIAGTGC
jgi:hypothetical protein